jgi:SAM-dependent methyltransferase
MASYPDVFCLCCGSTFEGSAPEREGLVCPSCGSISRDRYMTLAVLGAVAAVSRHNSDPRLRIIGVSDSEVLSQSMRRLFGDQYENHQFHEPPLLDLCAVPASMWRSADIVTCSDVLEHVPSPASRAFEGLSSLLKPGGVAVLSVPHGLADPHQEHFPPLTETRIDRTQEAQPVYVGVDEVGTSRTFTGLVFHGGAGETLEHRVYNLASFERELLAAGFAQAYPLLRDHPGFGAGWEPWSRVWTAVK